MRWLKCQALSMSGRRCGSGRRVVATNYHGDGELYDGSTRPEPGWVRVYLCEKHRPKRKRQAPSEHGGAGKEET